MAISMRKSFEKRPALLNAFDSLIEKGWTEKDTYEFCHDLSLRVGLFQELSDTRKSDWLEKMRIQIVDYGSRYAKDSELQKLYLQTVKEDVKTPNWEKHFPAQLKAFNVLIEDAIQEIENILKRDFLLKLSTGEFYQWSYEGFQKEFSFSSEIEFIEMELRWQKQLITELEAEGTKRSATHSLLLQKAITFEKYLSEKLEVKGNSSQSGFRLDSTLGRRTDFIKLINLLYELNYFEPIQGINLSKKLVMQKFGELVGIDLAKYDKDLSQAFNGQEQTFLDTFIKLKEKAEKLYKEKQK